MIWPRRAHFHARSALVPLAVAIVVAGLATGAAPAVAQEDPPAGLGSTDSVLVTFTSEARLDAAVDAAPAGAELEPIAEQVAVAALDPAEAAALADQPGVVAVEPNGIVYAADVPDDPCYTAPSSCGVGAWHVDRVGLPAAWDVSHGTGVRIAIIDGGVDQTTPDLAGKVVGEASTIPLPECADHGTQGASLAAAATGNGLRIPGAGWDAQVLSIQALGVFSGDCVGSDETIVQAIDLAIRSGVRVINLSLTSTRFPTAMKTVIDRAVAAGIVVVAAAGNSNQSNPALGQGGYPAAYGPVLAVGASDPTNGRAWFSNHGSWVDVYAPGDDLQDPNRSVGTTGCPSPPGDCTIRGTSFAAPITSGIVALMLAARPSLRAADVELLLRRTANPGPGGILGVDARDALYDAAFRGFTPAGAGALGTDGATVHVATRATDGSVWHRPIGGRWNQAGGGIVGDPDLASAGPGHIDVVGLGGDRRAWIRRLDVGSAWQPVGTGQFSSALSIVSPSPGRLDLFGRGLDGALWHGTLDNGVFGGWRSLGGALGSEPDAVAVAGGRIAVFAAGTDGALWQRTFDGTRWLPWSTLGGGLSAGPGAVSWGPDRIDVVIRGLDGSVYHRSWNGTGWSAWRGLGGFVTSAPDLATRGPGSLDVVARAGDHHLWRLPFDGGAWGGWRPSE
jgi:hypothetical protein